MPPLSVTMVIAALALGERGAAALNPPLGDALAEELAARFVLEFRPFLAANCLSCHAGDDPKGDLRLDTLGGVTGDEHVNLRLVREMIVTGEMPPKTRPRPGEHERTLAVQWLDAAIAYVPADAPVDPGWATPHRLNRTEYRNTLRDLLGVDPAKVDVAERLPRDDTGYGFDNIADVLSTSPLAVEAYVSAAERAVEAGLGPMVEIGGGPRPVRPLSGDNGQPLPRGGVFLFSNGAARGTFEAPLEGEYEIRVKAWETPAGNERARLSVRIDRREAGAFDVSGTRGAPEEFAVRVRLRAGARVIAAHFTNDYYVKDQADRNMGVESIAVAGPLEEASTIRPAGWTRVFDAGSGITDEDERARAILRDFATRAYRRPATDADVAGLMAVYERERRTGRGFEEGVRTAVTAALVSPRFLFRTVAHPDPRNPEAQYRLDGYELASRLSYFLWSSMPDDALLEAAGAGVLGTEAGLIAQARRMLADGKAEALVRNFAGQWLHLRNLDTLAMDPGTFPTYDAALRTAMREEAERFFADVLRSDRSVLDLVDAPDTFLNERLARHYGIEGVRGDEFRRVTIPEGSPRGGVLTLAAVLTITSNPTRTSPVKRGLFVLDEMLGTPPPPPPPDIPPLEQAANVGPGATVRERLAAHTAVASCAACHNRLDPLGLSFEHFDAIGRWRDEEDGHAIDASGVLPGGERLDGVAGVKRAVLARADQFVETLAGRMLTYAIGRGPEPFDRPAVREIARRTRAQGDRMTAMIEGIVTSETFRTARGREEAR
ncbi:MAG: filamin [Phycisphaerae bacterium]|nr:MAG: filamin [Phycisphaerae bacterium]